MRRCPSCGATNAATATWCGQCFAELDRPDASDRPESSDAPAAAAPTADPVGATTDPASQAGAGMRRTADGLEWSCVACETYNPMERSTCQVCGTSFTARFADAEGPRDVDWGAARLRSALLPGLGHSAAGRAAQGAGRAVLFVVWLLGGITVVAGAGSRGLLIGAPLLLGAAAVHALTLHDIAALEHGRRELLAGRTLLWLVVGVTLALIVTTILGVGSTPTG
jgi:ribosomal protein L40E